MQAWDEPGMQGMPGKTECKRRDKMKALIAIVALIVLTASTACAGAQKCPWSYEEARDVQCISKTHQSMATFLTDEAVTCEVEFKYVNAFDLNGVCDWGEAARTIWFEYDMPLQEEPGIILKHQFKLATSTIVATSDVAYLATLMDTFGLELHVNCTTDDHNAAVLDLHCYQGKNPINGYLTQAIRQIKRGR